MIKRNQIPQGEEEKWVALITEAQKDLLIGQLYTTDSYFNPIQDGNSPRNWFISIQELDNTTNQSFNWVKNLDCIQFVPYLP